jgi:hypothetical protein
VVLARTVPQTGGRLGKTALPSISQSANSTAHEEDLKHIKELTESNLDVLQIIFHLGH